MDYLQAKNVRVVFLHPGKGRFDWRSCKCKSFKDQQQNGEARPVLRPVNLPVSAPFSEKDAQRPITHVRRDQKCNGKKQKSVTNVAQNVMPGFMTEDEKRFILCSFV